MKDDSPTTALSPSFAWASGVCAVVTAALLSFAGSVAASGMAGVVHPAPNGTPAMSGMAALTAKLPAPAQLLPVPRAWSSLSASEKVALQPLAGVWPKLSEEQRQKWLAFAPQYPRLSPDEQARIHQRMHDWSRLSAAQRNQARLNFNETKQLGVADKKDQWQAYQALPDEEKRRLAAQAKQAKLKTAAPVLNPQQNQLNRLTPVPAASAPPARVSPPGVPAKSLVAPGQFENRTLLPKQPG